MGMSTGYYLSESETDTLGNKIDETSYNLRTYGRYTFFDDFFIEVSYQQRFLEDDADDADIERKIILLTLGWEGAL